MKQKNGKVKRKAQQQACIAAISVGVAVNMSQRSGHAGVIATCVLFVCYLVK